MDLRLATIDDYALIGKMRKKMYGFDCPFSRKDYELYIESECIYFPIIDGKEGGFSVTLAFSDGEAKIVSFYIEDKGKGYGTLFYREMEKLIREVGCNKITLLPFNERAEKFWIRQGFDYMDEDPEKLEKKL